MEENLFLFRRYRLLDQAGKQRVDQKFTAMDLTAMQSYVLRYLEEHRGEVVYPKDIEKRFNLTHPTVSGLLQRLEIKGFLTCEPDPDDRRFKRVLLTEKAEECQKEIWQHIQSLERTMTAGMSETEVDTLVRLLDLAAQNLDVSLPNDCIKEECKP